MLENQLVCVSIGMLIMFGVIPLVANHYSLNGIKSKTVGDGQYGTARFASEAEIRKTFANVSYEPKLWRQGKKPAGDTGTCGGRQVYAERSDCTD